MSVGDHTGAAVVYAGQSWYNWGRTLLIPGLQADANIRLLNRQREKVDEITERQYDIIDRSLERYFNGVSNVLSTLNGVYPEVPQAAEYVPVDPCAVINENIECNIGQIERANRVAQTVTRMHQQSDFARAVILDPKWWVNVDMYAVSMRNLLDGKFDPGDLMEVTTDTAEMSLATGRVGGSRRMGRRAVMAARLRMQHEGRAEFRRQAEMAARLSPASRAGSAADFMVKPEQRIALALTQAQLIQNSLQNLYNRRAQKPPHRMARMKLRLEKIINRLQLQASKANLQNTFVPNYAAILQPQINAVADAIGGSSFTPQTNLSSYTAPSDGGDYAGQQGSHPNDAWKTNNTQIFSNRVASGRPPGY